MMDKSKYTTVSIPRPLYERIKSLIKDTGFKSVSDYVTYILREVVSMHESEKYVEELSGEELEEIKRRLKSLGYI